MKHNFMTKMVSALLAVVLSTAAFSITAYASGMISLPEGMLQEASTENEETEGYEDEA